MVKEPFFTCGRGEIFSWDFKVLTADPGRRLPRSLSLNIYHSFGRRWRVWNDVINSVKTRRVVSQNGMVTLVVELRDGQTPAKLALELMHYLRRKMQERLRVNHKSERRRSRRDHPRSWEQVAPYPIVAWRH